MIWLVVAGLWLFAVLFVLALCKAAGRADEAAERQFAMRRHPSGRA